MVPRGSKHRTFREDTILSAQMDIYEHHCKQKKINNYKIEAKDRSWAKTHTSRIDLRPRGEAMDEVFECEDACARVYFSCIDMVDREITCPNITTREPRRRAKAEAKAKVLRNIVQTSLVSRAAAMSTDYQEGVTYYFGITVLELMVITRESRLHPTPTPGKNYVSHMVCS